MTYTPISTPIIPSDKLLHLLTFAILSLTFYWILDTSRRRCLNFTLLCVGGVLGVGSEIVQGLIPNGRAFDLFDIVANVIGAGAAAGICSIYHRRMLERRRRRRLGSLSGAGLLGDDGEDLELGEPGDAIVEGEEMQTQPHAYGAGGRSLEEEVDNWDENAVDENWEAEEDEEEGKADRPAAPVKDTKLRD